jgi:hypothetical protein
MERNNAWLRELIGRLSKSPSDVCTIPSPGSQPAGEAQAGAAAHGKARNFSFDLDQGARQGPHTRLTMRRVDTLAVVAWTVGVLLPIAVLIASLLWHWDPH